MIFRSEIWLAAVRLIGRCMNCDTICQPDPAHRNEGKGMGIKQHDSLVAALCRKCHQLLDQGSSLTRDQRRALWNRAYARTMEWLTEHGFFEHFEVHQLAYKPLAKIVPRPEA